MRKYKLWAIGLDYLPAYIRLGERDFETFFLERLKSDLKEFNGEVRDEEKGTRLWLLFGTPQERDAFYLKHRGSPMYKEAGMRKKLFPIRFSEDGE